ncbi:MAG: Crp/Fnr family transcriptional regulator [Polyangiales bacterium]
MERKHATLRATECFSALSDAALAKLASEARPLRAARRRVVIDPASRQEVLVLSAGRVRVARRQHERQLTLGYYGPYEIVGEMHLTPVSDPVEVIAMEAVEGYLLSCESIRSCMQQEATFAAQLVDLMAARRLRSERRLESFLTRTVESRVAEFLLDVAERYGIADARGTLISVRFTHQEMASYVGSTRETVTVVLAEFKRQGMVSTDHRRIIVADAEQLRLRV